MVDTVNPFMIGPRGFMADGGGPDRGSVAAVDVLLSRIESVRVISSLPTHLRLLDRDGRYVSWRRVAAVERTARAAKAALATPAVRSSTNAAAAAKRSA
jgi:hypothetical protein